MIDKKKHFAEIASKRANKIVDALRTLSNCANPRNYTYSKSQVEHLFNSLETALQATKQLFIDKLEPKRMFDTQKESTSMKTTDNVHLS